jgi:hypothetical protein
MLTFECPDCGSRRKINQVSVRYEILSASFVLDENNNLLMQDSVQQPNEITCYYECESCGEELRDVYGCEISDLLDLKSWLRTFGHKVT